VPDVLGLPLYLTSNPNDGIRRQPTGGREISGKRLWPRKAFPRASGLGTASRPGSRPEGPRRRFRGPLLPYANRRGGRGAAPARLPGRPAPGAAVAKVSQGQKPDKPDKLFSSAYSKENGLFSHARGERFVRLVRLQQLFMGRPAENRSRLKSPVECSIEAAGEVAWTYSGPRSDPVKN
jgi:hypothetical protein